jgi:soluble lytic murein transglycosylase-like protein
MHTSRKRPPPPWQRDHSAPQHPVGRARRRFPSAEGTVVEPPARYRRAFDGAGDRGGLEERRASSDAGVQLRRRRSTPMERLRRNPVRHGVIGLTVMGAATPLAIARNNQMRTDPTHERQALMPEVSPVPNLKLTDHAVGQAWREARVEVAEAKATDRDTVIQRNVQRYKEYTIPQDLAEDIYDIALAEEIDPDVAFGLVRTESAFKNSATSHVGAIGLTQLMPSTARWIDKEVTPRDLRDQRTNLRIGFKYLNDLMKKYDGDAELALLAYNRGPGTVDRILKRGGNPDNGYADMVLRDATPDAHPTKNAGG